MEFPIEKRIFDGKYKAGFLSNLFNAKSKVNELLICELSKYARVRENTHISSLNCIRQSSSFLCNVSHP